MRQILFAAACLVSSAALAEPVQVFDWAKAPAGTVVVGATIAPATLAAAQAPILNDNTGPCPETE